MIGLLAGRPVARRLSIHPEIHQSLFIRGPSVVKIRRKRKDSPGARSNPCLAFLFGMDENKLCPQKNLICLRLRASVISPARNGSPLFSSERFCFSPRQTVSHRCPSLAPSASCRKAAWIWRTGRPIIFHPRWSATSGSLRCRKRTARNFSGCGVEEYFCAASSERLAPAVP